MTLYVTTSWDDGHLLDLRVAEMLRQHGLLGTFYVSPSSVELSPAERLPMRDLQELATDFEIGGHTLTHRLLTTISDSEAEAEIVDGKDALEQVVGTELHSFCYPGGRYTARDVELVRKAGFRVARTIKRYVTALPADLLQLHTTMHAHRHLHDAPRMVRSCGLVPARLARCVTSWDELAIELFNRTARRGGVFHLWGHSWEIASLDEWRRLNRVLAHIAAADAATYVTNGQLADLENQRAS